MVLNLKKLSLSLNEGLFLTEPGAEAGAELGIRFRGEVVGNLGEKRRHGLCNYAQMSKIHINLNMYCTNF